MVWPHWIEFSQPGCGPPPSSTKPSPMAHHTPPPIWYSGSPPCPPPSCPAVAPPPPLRGHQCSVCAATPDGQHAGLVSGGGPQLALHHRSHLSVMSGLLYCCCGWRDRTGWFIDIGEYSSIGRPLRCKIDNIRLNNILVYLLRSSSVQFSSTVVD